MWNDLVPLTIREKQSCGQEKRHLWFGKKKELWNDIAELWNHVFARRYVFVTSSGNALVG